MYLLSAIIFAVGAFLITRSFKRNSLLIILLIPLFYYYISVLVSLILIEQGFYIYEQNRFGFPNNSILFHSLYFLVFSLIIYRSNFNASIEKKSVISPFIQPAPKSHILIMIGILAFMVFADYILVRVLHYGTNRLNIYQGFKYARIMILARTIVSSVVIYYLIRSENFYRIIISLLIIAWNLIRYSVTGAFLPLLIPWLIVMTIENRRYKIPFYAYILGLILLLSILYLKYRELDVFFVQRIVLSGHTFWGSINEAGNGNIAFQLSNYLKSFFRISSFQTTEGFGMGYLMRMLSGNFVDSYLEKGVRFTGGMPAILIVNFGKWVPLLLYGILVAIYFNWLNYFLRLRLYSNVIVFLLATRIESIFSEIMLMGEIGRIHFKFMIILMLFILVRYFSSRNLKLYPLNSGSHRIIALNNTSFL